MVNITIPLSIWVQLASFFFTLSGIFGDLLVIRVCLFLAYVMLFTNACVGGPLWPAIHGAKGTIALDGIIWASIGLFVHGYSLMCLFLDEREIELDDDANALWRMFYRVGGLSKCLFQSIVGPYVDVVEFEPDDVIPTEDYVYILYLGQVHLEVWERLEHKSKRTLMSGDMFDLKYLGMFAAEDMHFESKTIRCTSITKTKLFRIRLVDLEKMGRNPFAKSVLQTLLIDSLSSVVATHVDGDRRAILDEKQCDTIFLPLRPWEEPKKQLAGSTRALDNPLGHLIFYMKASFSPPYPVGRHLTGIRQTQLPAPPHRRPENVDSVHLFTGILAGRTSLSSPSKEPSSYQNSLKSEELCDNHKNDASPLL